MSSVSEQVGNGILDGYRIAETGTVGQMEGMAGFGMGEVIEDAGMLHEARNEVQ